MQAVRLARYHTRRRHVVRFCGAYHGWWGDVQPGVGNPMPARDTFTLSEMSERTLHVLRTRRDIACVLVNPSQAMHPNAGPAADSALVDSARSAHFDKQAYADWLQRLRAVCSERGIVLILDEVFVGFRLAPGGAQEYFGVRADMVTYGKTLGGGLPVGALCGGKDLMKRFREDRPADICFARGTFNSHPYVMGAMHEFLQRLETPAIAALYHNLDEVWNERAARLNRRLQDEGLPVRVSNMSSIWTVSYDEAIALQLDAAILPARGGAGAELDRDRTHHLQSELHRCRLRRGGGPLHRRRADHAAGRVVVDRPGCLEQGDPAQHPARDARAPLRRTPLAWRRNSRRTAARLPGELSLVAGRPAHDVWPACAPAYLARSVRRQPARAASDR